MKKVHNGSRFPLWSRLLGHQMLLAPTHFFTLWCFTRDEHTTLTTAIHRMGGRPSLSKRSDNYWHLLNYQGLVGELPWLVLAPPFLCLACYSGWLMTQPWTRNHPAKKKREKKSLLLCGLMKTKIFAKNQNTSIPRRFAIFIDQAGDSSHLVQVSIKSKSIWIVLNVFVNFDFILFIP